MTGPGSGDAPMTPWEIASGVVLGAASGGSDPIGDLAPDLPGGGGIVGAMTAAMTPLLARTPCMITFSGGMDSSFVLAVALRAARRAGLPPPVPVMWRFPPDATAADETRRQDEVLAALGDPERLVLQAGDDLDFVGPVARAVHARLGPRFPANLHLHAPVVDAARGGSLITGVGGDQVLGGHGPRESGRRAEWRRAAATVLPAGIRARVRVRRTPLGRPWLQPDARRLLVQGLLERARAEERARADPWSRIRFRCDDRALELATASLRDLAAGSDVRVGHPFLHPGVQRQVAAAVRRTPLRRAELLRVMAAGDLPGIVTERHPKARFHQVFLRSSTRSFRAGWRGEGADPDLVDVTALQAFWRAEPLSTASALLDQQLAFVARSA